MGAMEVYIVRHGPTNFNEKEIVQGQIDVESYLTEDGKEQARSLGRELRRRNVRFTHVISSDLRRARETTEILLRYIGHKGIAVEYTPDLKERFPGNLEGKTLEEGGASGYAKKDMYAIDHEKKFGNVEKLSSVRERVGRVKERLAEISGTTAEPRVLIVGHEYTNSYLINELLGEDTVFHAQGNAEFHYLLLDEHGKVRGYSLGPKGRKAARGGPVLP